MTFDIRSELTTISLVNLNWEKGKPSGSIACMGKQQPRFYWSCSSVVMKDDTQLTPFNPDIFMFIQNAYIHCWPKFLYLFILTKDYSTNFTTKKLLTIEHMAVFVVKSFFMPPPFEEWWRGIKCYPCPCVRACVRASVRPSVIKIWCPLNNFWRTASIWFIFGMLI